MLFLGEFRVVCGRFCYSVAPTGELKGILSHRRCWFVYLEDFADVTSGVFLSLVETDALLCIFRREAQRPTPSIVDLGGQKLTGDGSDGLCNAPGLQRVRVDVTSYENQGTPKMHKPHGKNTSCTKKVLPGTCPQRFPSCLPGTLT